MRSRAYPRTLYERHGQVNVRNDYINVVDIVYPCKEDGEPDCYIVITKRKGFGSTGNRQSNPMSIYGVKLMLESFPEKIFYRYVIKVYLKRVLDHDKSYRME